MKDRRDEYLRWLTEANGYLDVRLISEVRYAAIRPLIHRHAIVTGTLYDRESLDDLWEYRDLEAARTALQVWDGTGEPVGWERHPRSGRRVAMEPGQLDERGRFVPVGATYVRP